MPTPPSVCNIHSSTCTGAISKNLPPAECFAWQKFYDSTQGSTWSKTARRQDGKTPVCDPTLDARSSPCDACKGANGKPGVACLQNADGSAQIVGISLYDSGLVGALPADGSMHCFSALNQVVLLQNQLTGAIANDTLPFAALTQGCVLHAPDGTNRFSCPLSPAAVRHCNMQPGDCACRPGLVDTTGRGDCGTCPAGRATVDGGCQDCPAGSFSDGSSTQSSTQNSTQSAGAASKCRPCPAGTFSRTNATACTACAAGQYTGRVQMERCSGCSCQPGQMCTKPGAAGGGGGGATDPLTDCVACPQGQVSLGFGSPCAACPPGRALNEHAQGACVVVPAATPSAGTNVGLVLAASVVALCALFGSVALLLYRQRRYGKADGGKGGGKGGANSGSSGRHDGGSGGGGKGGEALGQPLLQLRPSQLEEGRSGGGGVVRMNTSNMGKYAVGQRVANFGPSQVTGVITSITPHPGGGARGIITITPQDLGGALSTEMGAPSMMAAGQPLRETRAMRTSNVNKYTIGQRVNDFGPSRLTGTISQLDRNPNNGPTAGTITITLD